MTLKLVVLVVYFGVLLGIGYSASKKVSNLSDYYVGGKTIVNCIPAD